MQIGDLVTRIKYNHDIVFQIVNIENNIDKEENLQLVFKSLLRKQEMLF